METPIEAYNFTMEKVEKLRESGIEVVMKPSKSRENKEVIEKYSGPERIPPELWMFVSFIIKDKAEANRVYEAASYLRICGIGFDTGGCSNCRDWELDWSFKYNKGDEQIELGEAREEVEDLIGLLDAEAPVEDTLNKFDIDEFRANDDEIIGGDKT